ncbi:MAG TPA: nucleotidyltransferase domain-containing protein [Gemmataceae bacterium]|nr:nucleotidyltransferase domain-containing protein [Gemmataceae bacterium]
MGHIWWIVHISYWLPLPPMISTSRKPWQTKVMLPYNDPDASSRPAAIPIGVTLVKRTVKTPRRKTSRPDKKIVTDIVRRIVEAAQPQKVILFGSAARGEMGPNSDYDFLVIKAGKFNHWRLLTKIQDGLSGKGASVDVVVASTADIERYGDSPYLVFYPALREGKVVYDAQTLSSN